jgi:hypothetical protein
MNTNFHIFKDKIKPMWEDPANENVIISKKTSFSINYILKIFQFNSGRKMGDFNEKSSVIGSLLELACICIGWRRIR